MDEVRIDKWLWAARLYKSRTEAQSACNGGHVKLNGSSVRPAHTVRVGDHVEALAPRGSVVVDVLALAEKRLGALLARALYEDHSPPPPARTEPSEVRDRGAGRPTKFDRRALERLKAGW